MKALIATLAVLAIVGLASTAAVAQPGGGHSWFGLCTAWKNNENGRENGNAENAQAFKWLQQEAEDQGYETVEEFCETVPHPGGGAGGPGGSGGQGGKPSDLPGGPPF